MGLEGWSLCGGVGISGGSRENVFPDDCTVDQRPGTAQPSAQQDAKADQSFDPGLWVAALPIQSSEVRGKSHWFGFRSR